MKNVYIVSMIRTPIGRFGGSLSTLPAYQLGAIAVKQALARIHLEPDHVQELYMGNVISAGLGQAPATRVAAEAGLGYHIPCTIINKVCASGMKAIMVGAQSIMTGQSDIVVAGGMESMSNIPFYIPKARFGYKYGNAELLDGLVHDGLTDPYYDCAMGVCSDNTAEEMGITRQEQDQYAIASYKKAASAWSSGAFQDEVTPVQIQARKAVKTVDRDEEYSHVDFSKIPDLKPIFNKTGTTTAANASTINDGAAAVVLMSEQKATSMGIKPMARIVAFADAAHDPKWFTTAPSLAIPKALNIAGLDKKDIDYYEINEAFASVVLANAKKMSLDLEKINVHGGAIALGHPLGASGARITMTLANVLRQNNAGLGVAGICNGGGGASAIIIENI